jgi:hypothetical protein
MAFAKRKYLEFYDNYYQTKWTIEFWDESGVAETIFTGGAEPLSFRFGPSGDLETVIKDIECTVNIVQKQGEDYSWLLTDDDRKIKVIVRKGAGGTELATSSSSMLIGTGEKTLTIETGLTVTVGRNLTVIYDGYNYIAGTVTSYNSGTGVLVVDSTYSTGSGTYTSWVIDFDALPASVYYTGWLIPNEYIDDISYIKQISCTFSDQLRMLSSKLYTVNGQDLPTDSAGNLYTGFETVINQIFNILDKTDLNLNVNVACNLYEATNMVQTHTYDPFNQMSVNQDLWLDENHVPADCVTVLEELLKPFWCRIFQADNHWWIVRVRDMMESTLVYREYSYVTRAIVEHTSLSHKLITSTSLQKFTPYIQRIGGELSFIPAWKYRAIEVDYGLKNSLVVDLILDQHNLETSLNAEWTNAGNIFNIGSWTPATVVADTGTRHSIDGALYLASPLTDIFTSSHYTFSIACGKSGKPAFTDPTCEISLALYVGGVLEYTYDDELEIWEAFGWQPLTKIPFVKAADPRVLETQSIIVEPPPVDGQLEIRIFAPYKAGDGLVLFYLREVLFSITADPEINPPEEITNGKVYWGMYNDDNITIPDPIRIRVSDGDIAVNDLYNGGILINDTYASATWKQVGSTDVNELSLVGWLSYNAWEQHLILSKVLEASFIGLLNFYTVLQLTEFSDTWFLMNDVEYLVKSSIWSGNFMELKTFFGDWSDLVVLKSNTLPNEDGSYNTIIMQGGIATIPGGSVYELQLNDNGEFAGSTGITFDPVSGRLLKGGTLPLIEYRRQTETTGAGEYQLTWDEAFESGDVYSVGQVIWGVGVDGNAIPGIPYDQDQDGFKINFGEVVTFTATALIER